MPEDVNYYYEFGQFRLFPGERRLYRGNQLVPLTRKAFDTLLVLVESSTHLIHKDELMKRVWQDTAVLEVGLARNISVLRKALGEETGDQSYIETVTGYGYRFLLTAVERQVAPPTETLTAHTLPTVPTVGTGEATPSIQDALQIPFSRPQVPAPLTKLPVTSIAVLPFRWLNREDEQEHLGLGMADAVITRLCAIGGPTILPTSAVMRYSRSVSDPVLAGKALKVDLVIEGTVQRHADAARITVRMINVRDRKALWAGKLDSQQKNLFDLQDSVSEQITALIGSAISHGRPQAQSVRATANAKAYKCYLKGIYHCSKRTAAGLEKGIEEFKSAIHEDPNYALALAGLADGYSLLCLYGDLPPKDTFPRARAAAARALEIDHTLGEAYASLGFVDLVFVRNWPRAAEELRRAIQLSPQHPTAHHWYGSYLAAASRFPEAVSALRYARTLDPLSQIIQSNLGEVMYFAREYDVALHELEEALDIDDKFGPAHQIMACVYIEKRDMDQAVAAIGRAIEASGRTSKNLGILGTAYAQAGELDRARKILAEVKDGSKRKYVCSYSAAWIHCALGEVDEALKCLHQAVADQSELIHMMRLDPLFDRLRSDRRFRVLTRAVGVPAKER